VWAPVATRARFRLSTCGGVRLWVEGAPVAQFEPFTRNKEASIEIEFDLKEGDNTLVAHTEEICERDTDWYFELAYEGDIGLAVVPPVHGDPAAIAALSELARGVRPARDVFSAEPFELIFGRAAERDTEMEIRVTSNGHDHSTLLSRRLTLIKGSDRLRVAEPGEIPDGYHDVTMRFKVGDISLSRGIDAAFIGTAVPPSAASDIRERKRETLVHLACEAEPCAGRALAMLETGVMNEKVLRSDIDKLLIKINERWDCSDFQMVTLLWLWSYHAKKLPADPAERIKRAILDYRYWVDEPGDDTMWFWSENHVLCFHVSQALAGLLFPDEIFTASGRRGREQLALATGRLGRWFDSVEDHGLVEWNSAAYYPIDFIGLLALHQLAPAELAERAGRLLDRIFIMVGMHTLGGVPAGSQGRTYDKELRAGPLTELAGFARVAFGEGWFSRATMSLALFCAGDYVPPAEAGTYARANVGEAFEARYTQGLDHNGKLVVCKTDAAQLSCVVDHRTGSKGHQQHVLDVRLIGHPFAKLWVNHPGEDDPWGSHRPSYWAGNGILPRVAQDWDAAMVVFDLGENPRLPWTHAYVAKDGMDEIVIESGWLFARSGAGYAALWASGGLTPIADGPTAGREFRSPGTRTGWISVIGRGDRAEDFIAFRERVRACPVAFDAARLELSVTAPDGTRLVLDHAGGLAINGVPAPFDALTPVPRIRRAGAEPGRRLHFS